jgi:Kef-type K+ transport system membrane component KefB
MSSLLAQPLPRFIAQILAIVLLARVLGWLARRVGQPMVVAEITAGILLGPSLLGWIAPDVSTALFAKDSLVLMQVVSNLGLVLFMFLIGLELEPGLLRGRGHAPLVIAQTTFLVPLGLGVLLALYLYPGWAAPGVSRATFAIFVGATLSSTAFPVLARILAERRLVRSRVGTLAIACAAIDDVTAWCLLAFVVASVRASGLAGAAATSLLAIAYIAVMFAVVRPLLRRLAARVDHGVLSHDRVAAVILLLFASSWATELIGIHALFGAFLVGAIMPREGGLAHAISEKLGDIVMVVLLPLFFAYSGVRTEIGLLDSSAAWATCGLVVLVACVGKLGAGTLAARLSGMSWRESTALGALMNTRGLMVLIVLNLGLDFQIIGPAFFSMMVVMALATTFVATPILDAVYPMGEHVRDLLSDPPATAPAPDAARSSSGYTVLACVDDPDRAGALVALARAVSGNAPDARVHALQMRSPDHGTPDDDDRIADVLDAPEAIKRMSFPSSDPARDICRIADVKAADLVLLSRHGARWDRALGATSSSVVAGSSRTVGLLFGGSDRPPRDVLLLQTAGEHGRAAQALAERLRGGGARVTTVASLDAASADRGFDLTIAGLPAEIDASALLRRCESEGALLLVRGLH